MKKLVKKQPSSFTYKRLCLERHICKPHMPWQITYLYVELGTWQYISSMITVTSNKKNGGMNRWSFYIKAFNIHHQTSLILLKSFNFYNLCNNFNTQVPRYLLFCEGGIFSAHALTLVGTQLTPYIRITL